MLVITLNVCGLRDVNKRLSLMQWLSHLCPDIVCLQETHVTSRTEADSWFSPFGFLTIVAPGSSHSCGSVILYRPRLIFCRSWTEQSGRFLMAEFSDRNFIYRIACIYAPNRNPERDSFLASIVNHVDLTVPTILCGDFNAVFDRTLDRRGTGAGSPYRDSSSALSTLFRNCCVIDTWRYLHPGRAAFSWMRPDGAHASRIDFFGCPIPWITGVHTCDFLVCPYSDHSAVVTELTIPSRIPKGPGRWRLNVSLLHDDAFVSAVENFWTAWRAQKRLLPSLQAWWERGKERIKGIAIKFGSRKKKTEASSRDLLTALANHLRDRIDSGFTSLLDVYERTLARIAALDRQAAEGARVRARVQWVEEGEASTRFFLRLERKHALEEWVSAIRGPDGALKSDIDGILRSWVTFFSSLFSASPTDASVQDELLSNVSARLPLGSGHSCDGLLTVAEIHKALKGAATGKSPGSDGLPVEFYSRFWHIIGEDLVDVLNSSYQAGRLPRSLRGALITLIFKKGDRTDPKNWRPISLLNCDYKLCARALAGRLLSVLQHVVHPDQSCGVRGRFIGENVTLLRGIVDYTTESHTAGAILSLDQEKAFDRVDWSFLFRILDHLGFGSSFVSWVRLLYSGVFSSIFVNGYTSEVFFPSRGVRQGCPLSPLLYVLSIEVLAANLRASKVISGLALPGVTTPLPVTSLYADDTSVIALSDAAIREVFHIFARFALGTGAKLNLGKCEGLWLGPWRTRLDAPVAIKWTSNMVKVLGIFIGHGNTATANWDPRVSAVRRCLDAWRARSLSYSGRAIALNALALAKIWYTASLVPMPQPVLSELTSLSFNFFWAGKRDLVARTVLFHPRESGGFSVVSIPFKVHSLLVQWFRRMTANPGAWVSLLTYWCFDRYGVLPETVLSWPALFAFDILPPFFRACFEAWVAVGGGISSGGLAVGSGSSGGPLSVDSLSSKSCYQLLLDMNPPRPHCVEKCLPRFGPWDWHCTWRSLHFMPLDRQVIDLNWKIAHGVLYTAERLASFGYPFQTACFCGAQLEDLEHLFFSCPLAQSGIAWIQSGLFLHTSHCLSLTARHLLIGLSAMELRSTPKIFTYLLNVCKYFVWLQRNDHRFRSGRPGAPQLIATIKARVSFYLPLFAKRFSSGRQRRYFLRQWAAGGLFGSFNDSTFVVSFP